MLVSVIGACAWGIRRRHRWAWGIAAAFAAWQIYYGISSLILFLNAGGRNAPAPAKMIIGLLVSRTVILLALFFLLVLLSDREKMFNGQWRPHNGMQQMHIQRTSHHQSPVRAADAER